jgi:hypothetical protein
VETRSVEVTPEMYRLLQHISTTVKLKHSSHSLTLMCKGKEGKVVRKRKRADMELSQ